jgi:glycerol kinase
VLFVPALAGLAAPWWQPDARASFSGMSLATTRGSLVRAVLEGIAAQVAELVDVVDADAGRRIECLRVDGGLTNSRVLMQAQADLLQRPIEVYASPHATSLGAAALARLAITPAAMLGDVAWAWEPAARYEPQWSADRATDAMGRWRAAVDRGLSVAGLS